MTADANRALHITCNTRRRWYSFQLLGFYRAECVLPNDATSPRDALQHARGSQTQNMCLHTCRVGTPLYEDESDNKLISKLFSPRIHSTPT
jgi:hypothetical protein